MNPPSNLPPLGGDFNSLTQRGRVIRRDILPLEKLTELPKIRTEIVCDILKGVHTTDSLNFAGELLLRGVKEASITIYFILMFSKSESEASLDSFTIAHVNQLLSILDKADENWTIDALRCICATRPDLAEMVKHEASKKSGIEKVALLYCASPTDLTPGFQELGELINMSEEERNKQPIQILEQIEFDWAGKEDLFVQLLKLRNIQLASTLFGGSSTPTVLNLGNLEIGPIEWWLEWMMEVNSTDDGYWFCFQLGALIGEHLNKKVQDEFIAEFNKTSSKFRRLLMNTVLPKCKNITTEVFSEDSISFLLADLSREGSINYFHGHLLGDAATEQFVTEHLLPLLPDAKQPLLNNIYEVLRQAGTRHGRRYLFD